MNQAGDGRGFMSGPRDMSNQCPMVNRTTFNNRRRPLCVSILVGNIFEHGKGPANDVYGLMTVKVSWLLESDRAIALPSALTMYDLLAHRPTRQVLGVTQFTTLILEHQGM